MQAAFVAIDECLDAASSNTQLREGLTLLDQVRATAVGMLTARHRNCACCATQ
jgi:hypothetical protein